MQTPTVIAPEPAFGPLVPECRRHGIGRTKAFELAAAGLIETFQIGTKRYVVLDSLRTLPRRLAEGREGAQ